MFVNMIVCMCFMLWPAVYTYINEVIEVVFGCLTSCCCFSYVLYVFHVLCSSVVCDVACLLLLLFLFVLLCCCCCLLVVVCMRAMLCVIVYTYVYVCLCLCCVCCLLVVPTVMLHAVVVDAFVIVVRVACFVRV